MSNQLVVVNYPIYELFKKEDLSVIGNQLNDLLDKRHIASIINAFYLNTIISSNGMVYLRVKGLARILRTGNSGAERPLIYHGAEGLLAKSEVILINGEEYISGPSLIAVLDYRSYALRGKTAEYLKISTNLYHIIKNSNIVRDFKDIFLEEIEKQRKYLKSERIDTYKINRCEFSEEPFYDISEVEFAHIDSVILYPHKALDINNGVIILKSIHAILTREGIHTFEGMFNFCKENGFSLEWADRVR